MTDLTAAQTKTLKRPSDVSITITDTRPRKKNCRIAVGSLSIPKNDSAAYRSELSRHDFYTFCPSDRTNLDQAIKRRCIDRVIYGMCWHSVIERLELDARDRIPWQVPKVMLEYKRIDYEAIHQNYSIESKEDEGKPVSPTSKPGLEEMSRVEYEAAAEAEDPVVVMEAQHLFEFCRDADVPWLDYEHR